MAKKKQTKKPAAAELEQLTPEDRKRAERVLVSQGRAKGLLGSYPIELQRQLVAWCTPAGVVLPEAIGVAAMLNDYYAKMKAEVDDTAKPEAGQQEG